MGQDLLALHAEYQARLNETSKLGAATPAFKSSNALAPIGGGGRHIDSAASGDPEALATDLFAGPAYATTNVEDVRSQRDRAMGADVTFGIDRTGMGR